VFAHLWGDGSSERAVFVISEGLFFHYEKTGKVEDIEVNMKSKQSGKT
jgi:hypothetical protein